MKKNNHEMVRSFYRAAWIVMAVLSAYIILKGCLLFVSADLRQTIGNLYEVIVLDTSQKVVLNHSPILQYINSQVTDDGTKKEDAITEAVSSFFVFNQYASYIDSTNDTNALYNVYLAANNQLRIGSYYSSQVMSDGSKNIMMSQDNPTSDILFENIGFIEGEVYYEDETTNHKEESAEVLVQNSKKINTLLEQKNLEYLIKNFYTVDSSTAVSSSVFQVSGLLNKDMTLKQDNSKPQILLFHTHSKEAFKDSRSGKQSDSIVGIGDYLERILTEDYGYQVIHDRSTYDSVRDRAYGVALPATQKILNENPSIEVIIDLHRDGVGAGGTKRVTSIDGKPTAQIMFFNGLSRNHNGPIEYLENKNLEDNLAFSLQMQLKAMELYSDFARKIYLKNYRFNMHQKSKYLLIELGNEHNTVQEAKNAMEPLAKILDQVLQGK